MARRRAILAVAGVLAGAMALAGCVDHAGPDDTRASAVYAAVVRWFVHDETGIAAPPEIGRAHV